MTTESLKDTIKRELPTWLREDPAFRTYVLELTRDEYADRRETGDRFYELLGELRRDREKQERKWEANQAELERMREEQAQKWEQQNRRWDENQAEWRRLWDENRAEQSRLWEESRADSNRRWDANQEELKRLHNEIMAQAQKFDRGIGALGSRWGLQSEKAFRDALAAILEQSFDVQVVNVTDYDDSGEVFGRPDQIELDVIIKNGLLLICELKSSIDKAGMYIFERKARFYERRHERKADRLIVISPMIDARARKVGERLGIEMYGDSSEVEAV
ncbi:PD-(D/E)XK nuclease family protein [Thiocapsa marina]|uniref:DUF3782 domain-containing protein n=1 Tax=Thiocapsa marina 5811 TaxID=768671 RepID=F9UEM4_9GAMM|nr:DUF3782 domain-containing protein [Thiocapsa marina]EGV17345.1 protein of unknown function DUF1626 [Thiocapsa marina 5811]